MKINCLTGYPFRGIPKKWGLIMRLTFFLLIGFITASGNGYSQGTRLNIKLKNVTVYEMMNYVEENSEFVFLYKNEDLDLNKRVDLDMEDATIQMILDSSLREQQVDWDVYDRQIVIHKASNLIIPSSSGQQRTVSGIVTDQRGLPVPGVTVVVKGTTIGTLTNPNGTFSLSVASNAEVLQFSFVGMRTQDVPIDGNTTFTVVMEEVSFDLEEVVAVGYGTMKKKNLTGAVDMVSGEVLESRPIRSLGEGLQGLIPNLNVEVSGDPSRAPTFNIRGFESISGGNPLILIDGIPGDPNKFNPSDIQSVNVLKDAAAAAVYGARGAYGVILIETKGGQKGKAMSIDFTSEFSMKQPIWHMDPVTDPLTHVEWRNTAEMDRSGTQVYDEQFIQNVKRWKDNPTPQNLWGVKNGELQYYGNSNFQDEVLRWFSPQQDYNLNVSGGSENATYYASFGYLNTDGLLKVGNDNFKRYNALLKNTVNVNDWFAFNSNFSFNAENSDQPFVQHWTNDISGALTMLTRYPPVTPFMFPKQEYFQDELPPAISDRNYSEYENMYIGSFNIVPDIKEGGRKQFQNSEFRLLEGIVLNPIKNLEIRGEFGYQLFNQRQKSVISNVRKIDKLDLYAEDLTGYGVTGNDYVQNHYSQNHYYTINAVAEYDMEKASSAHAFNALIGYNQEWNDNNWTLSRAYDLISSSVREIGATTGDQMVEGGKSQMSLRGGFYRLSYRYNSRYLFEFNGRYDGTSRFPKDDRYGFFPSFSAGWIISEENFMAGFDFLSILKIRGSYGSLGNQDVPYYVSISTMRNGLSNYMMGGSRIPYVSSAGLVSPTLTWETVNSKNIGVDIGLFDNKLTASFDAYIRETKDMLMDKKYPDLLGTRAPKENAADLETRGWEFKTTYFNKIGADWNYSVSLSLSDWTSEITKYENPTGAFSDYYVGKKIGEIWGFETVGIIQNEEELQSMADQRKLAAKWDVGDIRYKDLNGDNEISFGNNTLSNPGDRKIIGNTTPRYSYGMQLNLSYKSLALRTFFQGVGARDFAPPASNWQWFWPFSSDVIDKKDIKMSWREDNRDAYFYKAETQALKNQFPQTRYLQDASYIRLKNISLNYTIPTQALNSIGFQRVQGLQIYLTAMNVWEYSKINKPFDPEYIFSGTSTPYPLQRTYSIGAKISFQ